MATNLDEALLVLQEGVDDFRVEVLAVAFEDDVLGDFVAVGRLVDAGGRERIVNVGQGDNARPQSGISSPRKPFG